jgi:hypothetical protein
MIHLKIKWGLVISVCRPHQIATQAYQIIILCTGCLVSEIIHIRQDNMALIILTRDIPFSASLVHAAVDDNDIELVAVLEDADVLEGIAIHQDAVGIVAWPNFAQLVGAHEEFCNTGC